MKKEYYLVLIIFLLSIIYILIPTNNEKQEEKSIGEKRAIFISYIELNNYLKGKSESNMKTEIDNMLENIDDYGFNMIILQVRSFQDAIYESSIFPSSSKIVKNEGDSLPFDILDYFINKSKKKDIELHAWINPYRISTTTDTTKISKKNKAYSLLNTNGVEIIEGKGIFYNPAEAQVEKLILDGVEEIIKNYDVDGVHFDDYFYPASETIDQENYLEAKKENENLSLQEFRLSVTTSLIKKTYDLIKSYDEDILFGISPDGNIENNYQSNYIDTKLFLSEKGYLDYIMPQVYYGFLNSVKPFEETVTSWNNLITNNVILIPALAFYKTGNIDNYAKDGINEWTEYNNIIANEVLFSRKLNNYKGFAIFRYDSIFNENLTENSFKEKENLKSIL